MKEDTEKKRSNQKIPHAKSTHALIHLSMSSIGGMFYSEFCAGISLTCAGIHQCRDVITFCLYLLNKMRRNLIKIRPCAIFSWFNQFYRFVLIFRPVNVMVFDWLIRKDETFSMVNA